MGSSASLKTVSGVSRLSKLSVEDEVMYNSTKSAYRAVSKGKKSPNGLPVEQFFDDYKLLPDTLGRGQYGEVRLSQRKEDLELFAVKIVLKKNLEAEKDLDDHRRECEILGSLDHDNIVKLQGFYEDQTFFYMVMEYCPEGELCERLTDLVDFSERESRDIILTLVYTLLYCQKKGIAHRDIKPSNILLRKKLNHLPSTRNRITRFREATRTFDIVLADWGFAAKSSENGYETTCGSPLFVAPEIINEVPYNYKCDIWSLGVLCFLMVSGGVRPFLGKSTDEYIANVLKGDYKFRPKSVWAESPECMEFIKRCLVLDPSKRATYEELLNMRWFKQEGQSSKSIINMSEMKLYNSTRQIMKDKKFHESLDAFKSMMTDLNEEVKLPETKNKKTLSMYLDATVLTQFYTHPELITKKEQDFQMKVEKAKRKVNKVRKKKHGRRRHKNLEELPIKLTIPDADKILMAPTSMDQIRARAALNTVYFKNIDDNL